VARIVIRTLQVWDAAAGVTARVEPGTAIASWQIRKDGRPAAEQPYRVEFESAGRRYCCPLAHFQPRTEATGELAVE